MSKPQIKGQFYTTRTAAEQLGVSLRCIQLWCEQGKLQHMRTSGGHRRIYQHAVTKMLAEMKANGSAINEDTPSQQPGDTPYWLRQVLDREVGHYRALSIPRVELTCRQQDENHRVYTLTVFGEGRRVLIDRNAIVRRGDGHVFKLYAVARLNTSAVAYTTSVSYDTACVDIGPGTVFLKSPPIETYLLDLS